MALATFDTLEAATKLEKSGIEREQAITFVSVMRDANNDAALATKQDLINLKNELNSNIANVRTELKEDIANVRTELKEDIHSLDKKIDGVVLMLAKQETSLTIRFGTIVVGAMTLLVGIQTLLQYLLPK